MSESKLTADELKVILDAKIRRDARYELKRSGELPGLFSSGDDKSVSRAASRVYDSIISSMTWDQNVVNMVRSVKFSRGYVAKIIKAGLDDGTIVLEEIACKAAEKILEEQCQQ